MRDPALIRNFCIIAHIDHGKSTLADRFIEKAKVIEARKMQDQMLDNMDIERERGITIKSQAVALEYEAKDGKTYTLNLVDTPGHVDFSYEVSRAISSCEGALLLIDATQGVEAQTLSNMYMALEHDLEIIPVINKIDMPAADPEEIKRQIEHDLGLDPDGALLVSGRYGTGVDELFEAIVTRIPAPKAKASDPLQALIFDSHYDPYRGVVVHLRVFGGSIVPGQRIRLMYNGSEYVVEETGQFRITLAKTEGLRLRVGRLYHRRASRPSPTCGSGDTVTDAERPCAEPLPGFREVKPVVFSSIYPMDAADYDEFKVAVEKLKLNDASLDLREGQLPRPRLRLPLRLPRAPPPRGGAGAARARVRPGHHPHRAQRPLQAQADDRRDGLHRQPRRLPRPREDRRAPRSPTSRPRSSRPWPTSAISSPSAWTSGACRPPSPTSTRSGWSSASRCLSPKSSSTSTTSSSRRAGATRASTTTSSATSPPSSPSSTSSSTESPWTPFPSSSTSRAPTSGPARSASAFRNAIPRQQFKVPIQGSIGSKVIARETINPVRKDVLAKCYGGDISRKRKLLEKQKEGKKRMKMVGDVELPQEAFLAVLRTDEDEDKKDR